MAQHISEDQSSPREMKIFVIFFIAAAIVLGGAHHYHNQTVEAYNATNTSVAANVPDNSATVRAGM